MNIDWRLFIGALFVFIGIGILFTSALWPAKRPPENITITGNQFDGDSLTRGHYDARRDVTVIEGLGFRLEVAGDVIVTPRLPKAAP